MTKVDIAGVGPALHPQAHKKPAHPRLHHHSSRLWITQTSR